MNSNSVTFLNSLTTLGKIVTSGPLPKYLTDLSRSQYVDCVHMEVNYSTDTIVRHWVLSPKGKALVSHPSWR